MRMSRKSWTLVVALLVAGVAALAGAVPPATEVTQDGFRLAGVSPACPVIYDNDWWRDVPDAAFVWAKASLGQCHLRANIVTRCTFGWETGYAHTLAQQTAEAEQLLRLARESGLENIPDLTLGATEALRRPESGRIEDTQFVCTAGSDRIVEEARRASATQPLLVFVGGSCTTVATAYLTEPAIATNLIVFQVDGGGYNGSDQWAWKIALERCRFCNWARGYFWEQVGPWRTERFDALPDNPLGRELRRYARSELGKANQWGDGAWPFFLFDPRCLTQFADYDGQAITIPRAGTNVARMADEFFSTLTDPRVYQPNFQRPSR